MRGLIADTGFCMGIERAYRGIDRRALADAPFTVAHQNSANPFDTLRRIAQRDPELLARYPGLGRVSVTHDAASLGAGDRLVLGFHGLPDEAKVQLAERGVDLLDDHLCPFIAKLDRVVARHVEAGYDVAMVGSPSNHHLATAREIARRHGRRCYPIVAVADIEALPFEDGRPIALVGEVTGNTQVFSEVIDRIGQLGLPVKVKRTMCADSHHRQRNAMALAREADVVVVVDDGGDGARSVAEVCQRINPRLHRISDKQQVDASWFADAATAAVVGGIMIPRWTLAEVAARIGEVCAGPPP